MPFLLASWLVSVQYAWFSVCSWLAFERTRQVLFVLQISS